MSSRLIAASTVTALAALLAPAVHAQTTIAVSSWVPPSHHMNTTIKGWCDEVEAATQGRVKCNLLAKPVAPPLQALNSVRQGLADASFSIGSYNTEPLHAAMLVSTPFALGPNVNGERVGAALWRTYRTALEGTGEFKGVKVLAIAGASATHLYSSSKPLVKAADLKGAKVMVGSKLSADIVVALGGQPVVKPASQLYEMFSGRIVDASINPIETVKSFKISPFVKHATMFPGGMYSGMAVFYVSDAKWKSISPADQAAIEKVSGEKLSRRWGAGFDAEDAQAIDLIRKNGTEVVEASPEFIQEIKAVTSDIRAGMLAAAKERGVADPEKMLERIRAEVDKAARE